jgi:hypothetical protein
VKYYALRRKQQPKTFTQLQPPLACSLTAATHQLLMIHFTFKNVVECTLVYSLSIHGLQEWNYFLRGDAGVQDAGSPPAKWLTAVAWNNVCYLDAKFSRLQGLKASIEQDASWQRWYTSETPELMPYPTGTLTNSAATLMLSIP